MPRRIPALMMAIAMSFGLGATACVVDDDEPTIVETADDEVDEDEEDVDVDVDVDDEETPEDVETT